MTSTDLNKAVKLVTLLQLITKERPQYISYLNDLSKIIPNNISLAVDVYDLMESSDLSLYVNDIEVIDDMFTTHLDIIEDYIRLGRKLLPKNQNLNLFLVP